MNLYLNKNWLIANFWSKYEFLLDIYPEKDHRLSVPKTSKTIYIVLNFLFCKKHKYTYFITLSAAFGICSYQILLHV